MLIHTFETLSGKRRTLPDTSGYAGLVLGSDPVGYWRMGERSNFTLVADYSTTKADGTALNNPTRVPGALDGDEDSGLRLNRASSQYVIIGDNAKHSFIDNKVSVEFWFAAADTTGSQGIIGKRGGPWEYAVYSTPGSGQMSFALWTSNGTLIYPIQNVPITDTLYHHYAWTLNGASAWVYRDGKIVKFDTILGAFAADTTAPLEIGRSSAFNGPLLYTSGDLDEVALYSSRLTADEVAAHYLAGKGEIGTIGQRLGGYRDRLSPAGGGISADGVITAAEFNAFPTIYSFGTKWKVREQSSGVFVMSGTLNEPEVADASVTLGMEGLGQQADERVERFLASTQNLDFWSPGSNAPLDYPDTARIGVEVRDDSMVFSVGKNISFKKNQNGDPQGGWSSGMYLWVFDGSFSPIDMDQLQAWVRADTITKTVKAFGTQYIGAVTTWPDLSGNKNNGSQRNAQKAPLLLKNALGVKPGVEFNGTTRWMSLKFPRNLPQPNTIVVVTAGLSTDGYIFDGGGGSLRHALYRQGGAITWSAGTPITTSITTAPLPFDIWTAIYNGAASELYRNGVLVSAGDVGAQAIHELTLGARFGGTAPFGDPTILDVFVFSRLLPSVERQQLEQWLVAGYPSLALG